MFGTFCFLLGVAVLGCDGRAADYQDAAARIYPPHWALVRSVEMTTANGYTDNSLAVALPIAHRPYALYHEVGHVVALAEGGWRWQAYYRQFWPNGRQVGPVITDYARTNVWEDYAESYAALASGDGALDRCCLERATWLRAVR